VIDYLGYYHGGGSRVIGKVLASGYRVFSFYTLKLLETSLDQGSVVVADVGKALVIGVVVSHETRIPVSIQRLPKNEAGLEEILRETRDVEEMITSVYTAVSIGYYMDGAFHQGPPPYSPLILQKVYLATRDLVEEFFKMGGYVVSLADVVEDPHEFARVMLNHLKFLSRYLNPVEVKDLFVDTLRALGDHGFKTHIPLYLGEVGRWMKSL